MNVQLAPVPFDDIVRSESNRLAAGILSRHEGDLSGRRAVRIISAGSGVGLVGDGRVATWYVEGGSATLVGTTSEAASAGTFDETPRYWTGSSPQPCSSRRPATTPGDADPGRCGRVRAPTTGRPGG